MTQKCEYLDQCGFFLNFANNMEVIKESWIKLYCHDSEISELCERKIIRHKTGNSPVSNMAPTGKLM